MRLISDSRLNKPLFRHTYDDETLVTVCWCAEFLYKDVLRKVTTPWQQLSPHFSSITKKTHIQIKKKIKLTYHTILGPCIWLQPAKCVSHFAFFCCDHINNNGQSDLFAVVVWPVVLACLSWREIRQNSVQRRRRHATAEWMLWTCWWLSPPSQVVTLSLTKL